MKKTVFLVLAIGFAAALTAGCAPGAYGRDERNIGVDAGKTFVIALEENPTAGYAWSVSVADESVVVLEDSAYTQSQPDKNIVGAGGVKSMTFKGLKAGKTRITLVYERSFEEGSAVETLEYDVTVK